MKNVLPDGCPRFLTKRLESDDRYNVERACAFYIRDANLTPKKFAKCDFRIRWLHPYLTRIDRRWVDVPISELKTTAPRHLCHGMNTHINRWRKDLPAVQKAIDDLPEPDDQTGDLIRDNDHTDTDNDNATIHELEATENMIDTTKKASANSQIESKIKDHKDEQIPT